MPGNNDASSPRKRKRTTSSSLETQQDNIRLKIDLPSRPIAPKGHSRTSPRHSMSSEMDKLVLKDTAMRSLSPTLSATADGQLPAKSYVEHDRVDHSNMIPSSTLPRSLPSLAPSCVSTSTPSKSATRLPKTPDVRPVPSPAAGPTVSPLTRDTTPTNDLSALDQFTAHKIPDGPNREQMPATQSASLAPTTGPRGRGVAPAGHVAKSRRRNSPPPSWATEVNDLVWSDAEITGHDPDDPDDDLYGINGIGFRPTAAMAEQRRAQRRRQIAGWRTREDNEKRTRRRQTRHLEESVENSMHADEEGKKVRFLEQVET